MEQHRLIDLARLESEIKRPKDLMGDDPLAPLLRRQPVDYAQPHHRDASMPLPHYVRHIEGVSRIGALSAEAVVRQYDAAAKEIETMGEEMKNVVARCEEIIELAYTAMEQAKATAASYRDEAKRAFAQLEECALLTQEVSRTCQIVARKISTTQD